MGGSTARDLLLFHAAAAARSANPAAKRPALTPALAVGPRSDPAPPRPSLPAVAPAPQPAPGAPSARGAPGEALAGQVAAWAVERCRMEHASAEVARLLADFRAWAGAERVDARAFERALAALGGVRVVGGAVVVGIVLR